jgi:LacI family transcriptional regulator
LNRDARKATTIRDLAAAVGLSPAAVSLALRGKSGVSNATRARVLEASARMGYQLKMSYPLASTPPRRSRDPMTVTLVIRALPDQPTTNVFYGPILSGIEERCRGLDIRLVFAIMPVDEHNHPLGLPRSVTDHPTDGLILVGADIGTRWTSLLRVGAVPAVLVDGYAEDEALASVDIDNVSGARTAVRYLISRGHREIAIVGTAPDAFPSVRERRVAYEQTVSEARLTPHYVDVPYYDHERAAEAAVQYVLAHPEVTAIFCANDLTAITFLQAARVAGVSVPDQVSVVGFDDIDLASIIRPGLTTMAVNKPAMGRLAVTLLLHQLDIGKITGSTTLVKPTLVERATVRTIEREAPEVGAVPVSEPAPV